MKTISCTSCGHINEVPAKHIKEKHNQDSPLWVNARKVIAIAICAFALLKEPVFFAGSTAIGFAWGLCDNSNPKSSNHVHISGGCSGTMEYLLNQGLPEQLGLGLAILQLVHHIDHHLEGVGHVVGAAITGIPFGFALAKSLTSLSGRVFEPMMACASH